MADSCASYIRQVGRELELPRRRKRELLNGLRLELEEQFPEEPGTETLLSRVGRPEETARALRESVHPEEHRRYHAVRQWRIGCLIAALALLLAVSVAAFFYFDTTRTYRAEVIIIEDPVPVTSFDHSALADNNLD